MVSRIPSKQRALSDEALSACREVLRYLKLSPGGDLYIYAGSTNAVDDAKEAMEAVQTYQETGER